MTEMEIPRDRWGRPLITPVDGGKPEPYTRVSTLAKTLDDKTALTKWMCRQTAIGLSQRPDLVSLVGASLENKKTIGDAVEQAMVAAKSGEAANIGTTLHSLTEQVDAGGDIEWMPTDLRADLEAYKRAMDGIQILSSETFIVQDQIKCAGTFDRLVRLPDGRIMVADVKTGQNEPQYPHATATQIAIYSRGHLYTPESGRVGSLADLGVSTTTGLMIHMPAKTGTCTLYEMDLVTGWTLATVAYEVRLMQKSKPIAPYTPAPF